LKVAMRCRFVTFCQLAQLRQPDLGARSRKVGQ
jgi:hypothetical protein